MKTKIVQVEHLNKNQLFDPQLVKNEFRKKIDYRLSIMHQNRRKVIKRHGNSSSSLRKCRVREICSKVFKGQGSFGSTGKNLTAEALGPYIQSAMKLQQNAFEAALSTNRGYNAQLLLIFLESFITLTFNSYYLISVIAQPASFKLPRADSIAYLSQHLIQPCLCAIVPVVGFRLVQLQFRKSQGFVNRIIIHAEDNTLRSRFLAFSQQIQLNIPLFTIYGFFSLDGSLIFSMISAITTYLIILVQTLDGDEENSQ